MAATATASLHLFLILSLFACSCSVKSTVFPLTRREILNSFRYKVVRHDSTPSAPTAIVTVPATNPVGVTPNAPVTPPVTTPASPAGAQPVTNPVTTPASPGAQPVTNPNPTPTPTPTPPTSTTNPPVGGGQSWCVAKSGLSETTLQTALNYACGVGGADCSAIQQGGSCYNPISLQNHASFAFNSYYQKNPAPTSCDFGGSATITNQNPSSGSCVYPASSAAASGTPSIVPTARPGAPPNALNSSTNYPPSGGTSTGGGTMGASPPTDGSYASLSNHLQAAVGSIALVTFITTTVLISPLRQDHGWKSLH